VNNYRKKYEKRYQFGQFVNIYRSLYHLFGKSHNVPVGQNFTFKLHFDYLNADLWGKGAAQTWVSVMEYH
jgi:hypothetical protein